MIKKKIAMLGAFSVGKTSLVEKFVHSMFSEKYHTTVGVKVDKKDVTVGNTAVTLLIWDIHGEDSIQEVSMNYLRGASGYLLVADGTRPDTLAVARELQQRVERTNGPLPFLLLLNKADLKAEWRVDQAARHELGSLGWRVTETSAKSGLGVEEAFSELAGQVLTAPV